MAITPNEVEQEKALAKATEYDDLAVKSPDDIGKLMNPAEVSGNIYGRGPGKGKKKAKSK
jgi:hypothetical protein